MRQSIFPVAIGVVPQDNERYAGNSAEQRKAPRIKNNENGIITPRLNGTQRVPTGTKRGEENKWLHIIRTPDAKLETGAKTEHGRPDQNTNVRKLPEGKGRRDGAKRNENGQTGYETHSPSGKFERRSGSKAGKAGLGATCSSLQKGWRRRNPYLKSKVKVRFVFMQEEQRRHTVIRIIREYQPYGPVQRKMLEAYGGTYTCPPLNFPRYGANTG